MAINSREDREKNMEKKGSTGPVKFVAFMLFLVLVFFFARALRLEDRIAQLRGWISSLGAVGPFVFTLIYILAVVFAVPGALITILAGAMFGLVSGTIIVSIGSTAGAGICFLIARYMARDAVTGWVSADKNFKKLDDLIKEQGDIIVAVTRLVPLFPFNLLNYAFGLTKVKFGTYLFWSWLCMLPGTIVYVAGADLFVTSVKENKAPWPLIAVLAVAFLILVLLVKKAGEALKKNKKAAT
jgi:uncharacterized membrane protein YdjX (TVP38/TMEM64 family)